MLPFTLPATTWWLAPLTWLMIVQLAAMVLLAVRRARAAAVLFGLNAVFLIALTCTSLPGAAIRPLEQAMTAPRPLPQRVDGIITLSGAYDARLTAAYGTPHLNAEAPRLTELIALARIYPEAKLVVAGAASSPPGTFSEAEAVTRFLEGQGFDARRVIFEQESRNTADSAAFTHRLLGPRGGEVWLLVTSANHMPRAHRTFTKAGWEVVPYPVAYRVLPESGSGHGEGNYDTLLAAIHEWVGMAAYRLTGRM